MDSLDYCPPFDIPPPPQEQGVAMLTAGLEQCLAVRGGEGNDRELGEPSQTPPPVPREASERAIEILKTLFNITYSSRRQQPDQVSPWVI